MLFGSFYDEIGVHPSEYQKWVSNRPIRGRQANIATDSRILSSILLDVFCILEVADIAL
jgi:hypothetical protein